MFHYDGEVECQKHECSVSNIGVCDDFEHQESTKLLHIPGLSFRRLEADIAKELQKSGNSLYMTEEKQ